MIAILWRYQVREAHAEEFEGAYGPEGEWARLFARAEGFVGVELMKGEGGAYLTVDRWRSARDFDAFIALHGSDYQALDARAEGWTSAEERIGLFEQC